MISLETLSAASGRQQDQHHQHKLELQYLDLVPKATSWTQEVLGQSIRARMIRELQSTLLEKTGIHPLILQPALRRQ